MRLASLVFLFVLFSFQCVFAQKKAHVLNVDTDVYGSADFDAAVIGTIDPDETFLVSKKPYGAFYKVKFKDGTIGYIPDTEVYIEGVGTVKEMPFRGDDEIQKTKRPQKHEEDQEEAEDDTENPHINYKGVTFSLINFREDTMGGMQVSDLQAYGFRFQPMEGNYQSGLAYELMVALRPPDYYEEKTGAKTSGGVFWGSAGISNVSALNSNTSLRYGAGPFIRYSHFSIKDAPLRPQSSYNLQDLTAGLDFQIGVMLHSRYATIDLGLRYFWDKQNYGGFGVAFLF